MECNKRVFTLPQAYKTALKAFEHPEDMLKARKKKIMSKEMVNHIMLAVTEVNGCAMCAYAHTKDALEMGMQHDDIQMLLSGSFDHLDPEEGEALLFAQHYAETLGGYSKKAWDRIVEVYGLEKARGIMAAAKLIMFGNAYGIALGAFWNRLKGKPANNSSFIREFSVSILMLFFMIFGMIRGIFVKKYEQL